MLYVAPKKSGMNNYKFDGILGIQYKHNYLGVFFSK